MERLSHTFPRLFFVKGNAMTLAVSLVKRSREGKMNMGRGFFFNQTQNLFKWIISSVIQSKLQSRDITACYRPSPAVVNWLLLQQNVGYPRIPDYSVTTSMPLEYFLIL